MLFALRAIVVSGNPQKSEGDGRLRFAIEPSEKQAALRRLGITLALPRLALPLGPTRVALAELSEALLAVAFRDFRLNQGGPSLTGQCAS